MPLRLCSFLTLIVLAAPMRAAEEKAPTLVVRIKSIEGLLSDFRFLAEAAGKGEEGKQIEQLLKTMTGPKGLEGVDTKKPIGLYARMTPDVTQSEVVVLLPVADEKTLLALVERVGIKVEKREDDVYMVNVPAANVSVYFRFANGYAYGTIRDPKAIAKDRLLMPAAVLPADGNGTLDISVDLEQIPGQLKDVVIGEFTRNLSEGKANKKPDETDSQFKFRVALVDEVTTQFKAIVTDGKSVKMSINLDPKSDELALSFSFTAKPDSKLAGSIAELGSSKSVLANLSGPETAMFVRGFVAMPKNLRAPFEAMIDDTMKQALAREQDKRELLEVIFKAVTPTLKAAEIDAAMEMRGPQKNGLYTGVLGVGVKEGRELDGALRKLLKTLPEAVQKNVTLDAAKVGTVSIHQINVDPSAMDAESKRLFGDKPPIYFAVRSDAVLLAFGDGALDLLKEVAVREPKAGRLLQIDLSTLRLSALDKNQTTATIARKVFGKTPGDDLIHITVDGGKSLELRASVRSKFLEFGAKVDEAKKKSEK